MMIDIVKRYFPNFHEKELIDEIVANGVLLELKSGDVIMDIGQYIKTIPLLISGSIKIIREDNDGNELLMYYINAGETCAASLTCCMKQEISNIRAVAEDDVKVISIPIKYMDEWMKKYDSWKNFVLDTYRHRYEELLATIDSIAFMKMDERLVKYLLDKKQAQGSATILVTHQEIAQELNTSREVISRLLKQLEKLKKIALGRNKILLKSSLGE
jgi:CRP/FNR family transcriptional regulator, anaerobic regulatory protein